jgi:hypothetical protein
MGNWLLGLPVVWMSVVILGWVYLFAAAVYFAINKLAVGDRAKSFKAVSPGMLPPLSVVFALLAAFLAGQVWNDTQSAGTAVNREASALRAAVLLGAAFPGEPERRLRALVASHIQEVVTKDWPAMASGHATLVLAPPNLAEALRLVLGLSPQTPGQVVAQREIVVALESALDARRQRIILSHSSINPVKWLALLVQAGLTLIAIGMVHSDNPPANRIILTIFATSVAAAVILIAAHSRPFTGEISVSPAVLLQVMPEAGAKAAP